MDWIKLYFPLMENVYCSASQCDSRLKRPRHGVKKLTIDRTLLPEATKPHNPVRNMGFSLNMTF